MQKIDCSQKKAAALSCRGWTALISWLKIICVLASSQISQTLSVALLADCLVGEFQDVVGQTECKRKRSHLVVCGRLATVALIHISNPCVQSLRCKYIRGRACSSILQTYVSCPGGASRRLPLRPIDLPTPCTFYDSAPSLSAGL